MSHSSATDRDLGVSAFLSLQGNICNIGGLPFARWKRSSKIKFPAGTPADGGSLPAPGSSEKVVLWASSVCVGIRILASKQPWAAATLPEGRRPLLLFTFASQCPAKPWPQEIQNKYFQRIQCEHVSGHGPILGLQILFQSEVRTQHFTLKGAGGK